jgi:ethanolamine utilization protein EutA
MAEAVKMVGLDFGTTTSSAVIAAGRVQRSAIGRTELVCQEVIYRSEMVFTPLSGDRLDLARVEALLDGWLAAGNVGAGELFGGGALLTGLTAQNENAAALVELIRRRLGDALVATADDPCLESWLAFMGSCAPLSRQYPERSFLNLDIGGGTTNLALGQAGQVLRTGCLYLGARHVQVIPGSYRILKISTYARAVLDQLRIAKGPGDDLRPDELDALLTYMVDTLEAACTGANVAAPIVQVPFLLPGDVRDPVVTFSGGVGELVYRHLQGEPWPTTTYYGDLGIDLARRIVQAPTWAESLRSFRPGSGGRATVFGLLRHATEVSGNTLFLGAPAILPLADLPILGNLNADTPDAQIRDLIAMVRRSSRGGAVQVCLGSQEAAVVRALGERLARVLQDGAFPPTHPLVLLVEENVGKALGQYVTRWGALPLTLLVIDEVAVRDAQFVHIGTPRDQVVPVSFRGILPHGDRS